ncbi:hypothetical protein O0I10_005104 [Lichtheimia ornata]|uniref:Uncharacterized protein n=1 Tax=Lichtheimia ornata TaxID=688661 RepID=A0AAD7V7L8_9FUNG|nr:uncharacterized protein O0I10_005104 [Lichtheimia ornata]KAJ8659066.1 hypothetical protein O0I10_005104 [Lichtheimia ornata]
MRGIGSTKQNMLINEPCNETAAAPTGWHGYTVFIGGKDAIEKYHKREDGISIDALHRVDPQESTGTMTFLWLCALIIILHPDGLFGSKYAGNDCVIQRDHCRELLVFWCFGVYKITAMIANHGEAFMSFGGVNLYCVSGGWLPSNGRFLWRMSAN